jgi:hypothetical protein
MMTQSISTRLETNLLELSALAHSTGVQDAEKLNNLRQTTLAEINNEIENMTLVGHAWLEQIRSNIKEANWGKLPDARELKLQIKELRELTEAISQSFEYVAIDINAILSLLLEYQRKAALSKNESRINDRELFIQSANAEISKKESAALQQLTADLIGAAVQIATGGLQLIAGAISFKRSVGNLGNAKNASINENLSENLKKLKDTKLTLDAEKLDLDTRRATATLTPAENARAIKIDSDLQDINNNIKLAENNINGLMAKIGSDIKTNTEMDSYNRVTDAGMAISNSINSVIKGIGDGISAIYKFESRNREIEAERFGLGKNLASSAEQSSLDAYQQLRDSLRSILQTLSAIEQSLHSSFSSMAKI